MRKVTKKAVTAFLAGKTCCEGNTTCDGETLLLHGNPIARRDPESGVVTVTLAGWATPTTKERLNGLCELMGLGRLFSQKGWLQYMGSREISTTEWYTLPT